MIDLEMMEKLIKLGLTESSAKLYLLLLQKSSSTAYELSRHSGISRAKTYEILDILIKKGLCSELLGGVKKYIPVNPRKSFPDITRELKEDYEENLNNIEELISGLYPLFEAQKSNFDPLDFIQVFRSKVSSLEKAETLEASAEREILTFCKPPYAMGLNRETNEKRPYINKLREDIIYRSIYEIEEDNTEEFITRVRLFQEHGGIARVSHRLPMKIVIFDENVVILNLANQAGNSYNFTTLTIEHASLGEMLKRIFELYWAESTPIEVYFDKLRENR
jgi:sugar-specific transcriptional regulator TrmB